LQGSVGRTRKGKEKMICVRWIESLLDISGSGKIEPAAAASAGILGHGNHAVKDAGTRLLSTGFGLIAFRTPTT
jgi:hypothetical protein